MDIKDTVTDFWHGEASRNQSDGYWQQKATIREREGRATDKLIQGAEMAGVEAKVRSLEEERQYYRSLLAKPLQEIITEHTDLKKAYEMQQAILEDWMVSQEAFRQVARKLRMAQGMSEEEFKRDLEAQRTEAKERLKQFGVVSPEQVKNPPNSKN